jgi:predicted nucleotidyltransferase
MMNKLIEDKIKELQEICRKNAVAELYIFGSALTNAFTGNSDLDFAYVLKDDLTPVEYGDAFFGLLEDLETLFDRKIDLVSYRSVKNPIFKQELDSTKKSLYAAA